jgi:hypothetical protein
MTNKKIDKLKRNFLRKGEDDEGNKDDICLVKWWSMICRPKELGDLGIMDLNCSTEHYVRDGSCIVG